jgi:phage repressor protein C with HTH and peptisase S24 domain
MLKHEDVWGALDALAMRNRLSASGLARLAGLDATSFNKSKRITAEGRQRWPSTESIAKALKATRTSLDEFMGLLQGRAMAATPAGLSPDFRMAPARKVPLLGLAQAGVGGFFDDGGFPAGQGWDEVAFPSPDQDHVYALEVTGDSMQPLYRDGDTLIVQPGAPVRRGDRVVVRTKAGEVMAKVLARQSPRGVELTSLNPAHGDLSFQTGEIEWMARIIWASQ